ncbi:MAG: S-layer homology domain-containing protein [Egibacteraceae bacterium]
MTASDRFGTTLTYVVGVAAVLALAAALLPLAGPALAQETGGACSADVEDAPFTDRQEIPEAHRANVDCAADRQIVQGFEDDTFRPELQVRRDQMASFIALTLDTAGVTLPAGEGRFTDVPASNVHADNIERLAAAGIVEGGAVGLPADEYGPGLRTRRDQMASFLMRAAGYALHDDVDAFDSTDQEFTDVPAGNVHSAKVNGAAMNEIAQGTGGDQYSPARDTRRDQMASFVVRLLNFIAGDDPDPVAHEVAIEFDVLSGARGDTVTASVTGDVAEVAFISVTGDCVQDADHTLDALDQFAFSITDDAEDGICEIDLTVHFDELETGETQTLRASFLVTSDVVDPPQVSVSLDPDTGNVGATVTATVTGDVDRVESMAITGACVEDDDQVTLTDGAFTFDITSGDGDCGISFTATFDDDSTQTLTSTFIVEGG